MDREQATRSEVRNLVGRFFKNSHELLLLNLLQDRSLDGEELKRLREMIDRDTEDQTQKEEGAPKV